MKLCMKEDCMTLLRLLWGYRVRSGLGMTLVAMLMGTSFAQGPPTVVFKTIQTAVSTTPFTSNTVSTGFGPLYHKITAVIRSAPLATCTNQIMVLQAVVSMDGTTFYTPTDGDNLHSHFNGSYSGNFAVHEVIFNGLYPFVQASISQFDNTNCVVDLFYSGSLSPIAATYPYSSLATTPSTSGDSNIVSAPSNVIRGTNLIGLSLYNQTAAQTVILKCAPSGGTLATWNALPAGATVNWTNTFITCQGTTPFFAVNLANNTSVTIVATYYQF